MDMFLMTLLALDFKDIFAGCVFLGIWFYIAYLVINAFYSSRPRKGLSRPDDSDAFYKVPHGADHAK